MADKLKDKSIAITGAGRGIGRALALELAKEGAKIVVADFGGNGEGGDDASSAPADQVVEEIRDMGGEAVATYDDVATFAGGDNLVKAAVDNFGRLDGLVCNAGIMAPEKELWELTEEEWDLVLRVNLKGHFCPIRAAIPVMQKQGGGSLVYFSSSAGIAADHGSVAQDGSGPYGTSKAGVLGLMWGMATHLADQNITSNGILPGAATRLVDMRLPDNEQAAAFHSDNALGTWRDPKHIAPIVAYLLSDQGRKVNGQVFGAMGGRVAHYRPVEPQKAIDAKEGIGFSMDEMFRRFPEEFGSEIKFKSAPFPPPPSE